MSLFSPLAVGGNTAQAPRCPSLSGSGFSRSWYPCRPEQHVWVAPWQIDRRLCGKLNHKFISGDEIQTSDKACSIVSPARRMETLKQIIKTPFHITISHWGIQENSMKLFFVSQINFLREKVKQFVWQPSKLLKRKSDSLRTWLLVFSPANLPCCALPALVLLPLGRVHGDRLEGEQGQGVLYHQADQPLGVEDELVTRRVSVADVGVQALDLGRGRKNF